MGEAKTRRMAGRFPVPSARKPAAFHQSGRVFGSAAHPPSNIETRRSHLDEGGENIMGVENSSSSKNQLAMMPQSTGPGRESKLPKPEASTKPNSPHVPKPNGESQHTGARDSKRPGSFPPPINSTPPSSLESAPRTFLQKIWHKPANGPRYSVWTPHPEAKEFPIEGSARLLTSWCPGVYSGALSRSVIMKIMRATLLLFFSPSWSWRGGYAVFCHGIQKLVTLNGSRLCLRLSSWGLVDLQWPGCRDGYPTPGCAMALGLPLSVDR
jgi:hypothetical protein